MLFLLPNQQCKITKFYIESLSFFQHFQAGASFSGGWSGLQTLQGSMILIFSLLIALLQHCYCCKNN